MLQYIQTGFDYVEICRRRAMRELMQGSTFGQGSVMKFHLDVADSFMAKLRMKRSKGRMQRLCRIMPVGLRRNWRRLKKFYMTT